MKFQGGGSTTLVAVEHSCHAMTEKNIGISQQTLVPSVSEDPDQVPANKLPQYLAGLASTLGALACGMVLAWTSPAGKGGVNLIEEYNITMSETEFSWISSLANLGAAASCIPIGVLADLIGRKTTMLMLVAPFTAGWVLILTAKSLFGLYLGRFITGFSGGAFCVAAPMYTAEISENAIRGSLGSYFQLMLTVGILATYSLGSVINIFYLSLISAAAPILFFIVFIFMPETPIYYLKKGREDAARVSLRALRGSHYNIEPEIEAQLEAVAEARRDKTSFTSAIQSKAAIKGLTIGFGLMTFQQLSGVNAIIFYASQIFEEANKSIRPDISTIVLGVIQVVATFLSTLVVDKLGRRVLLILSDAIMFLTTLVLGVYFYLQHIEADVSNITWLPLLCICGFIFIFSIGFGPIPWMMMGELFSSTIKGIAGSSACVSNWLLAFLVTKYYPELQRALGPYTAFWIFSLICSLGTAFTYFVVIETKGKSLEQIQVELENLSNSRH